MAGEVPMTQTSGVIDTTMLPRGTNAGLALSWLGCQPAIQDDMVLLTEELVQGACRGSYKPAPDRHDGRLVIRPGLHG